MGYGCDCTNCSDNHANIEKSFRRAKMRTLTGVNQTSVGDPPLLPGSASFPAE